MNENGKQASNPVQSAGRKMGGEIYTHCDIVNMYTLSRHPFH